MLFGTQDSPVFRDLITSDTSSGVQGKVKKEFGLGLARQDKGYLGFCRLFFVILFSTLVKSGLTDLPF